MKETPTDDCAKPPGGRPQTLALSIDNLPVVNKLDSPVLFPSDASNSDFSETTKETAPDDCAELPFGRRQSLPQSIEDKSCNSTTRVTDR